MKFGYLLQLGVEGTCSVVDGELAENVVVVKVDDGLKKVYEVPDAVKEWIADILEADGDYQREMIQVDAENAVEEADAAQERKGVLDVEDGFKDKFGREK
jgi:hypothetical protein